MTLLVQQKQKEDKLGEDYFLSFLFLFFTNSKHDRPYGEWGTPTETLDPGSITPCRYA